MANKKFSDYVVAGDNITLTYDNNADTVTIDAAGNVDSVNGQTGVVVLTKTDIGLGNVDNTSDANKPISTATQTALNGKQDTLVSGTNIKTVNSNSLVGSGDVVIDKTSIGLGNVANVDTTNASNISSGTLSDSRLSANVTTQGNTFNAANKLVQLDANAKLPAVDGSQLTNLPSFTPPNGLLKIASAISTTFQAITDYLGNASVLFLNSRRVGIGKDTSVTTQSVAVVEVQDANTSIVLKPNGTGAIIASVPDGTVTGGNARGTMAVDLQMIRSGAHNVASGNYSSILGGSSNIASGQFSVTAGNTNTASGFTSISFGQSNNATSNYSTISGGQANTASTNTHATVVGGQSNTASGQWSTAGGISSVASGMASFAFAIEGSASGTFAIAIGRKTIASGASSVALGYGASTNGKQYSNVFGGGGKSNNENENIFANSQSQTNENIVEQSGYYQKRFQIIGGNSQNKGTISPSGKFISSGDVFALSTSFNFRSATPHYTPLYNNTYFIYESNITLAVNAITGTTTGVSVGDYKICKLLVTGKRYSSTNTILTSNLTVLSESSSMSTALFDLDISGAGFYIKFTAPTFTGGGTLDLTVMADSSVSEMKQNLA